MILPHYMTKSLGFKAFHNFFSLQIFYPFISNPTHSTVLTWRIISSISLLILRVLYPRAPSRPSVSPCRMGGTPASTSLISQFAQVAIPSPHVVLENIHIIDQNFCSLPNQIIFLVQYNFGKVCSIDLSDESIHLQVHKKKSQRYPDSRMELVALSGS